MSLEDEIFADAVSASGLKRTKGMYEPSSYPHSCNMCVDGKATYKLKPEYVESLGLETPYIFICEECFKELEE